MTATMESTKYDRSVGNLQTGIRLEWECVPVPIKIGILNSGRAQKVFIKESNMAKSPEEMAASMIANLKENTGKALDAWLKILKKTDLKKHGETVKHLKSEYDVTHGYANMIAMQFLALGKPVASGDGLVDAQYSGPKSDLRPIYDALIKAISKFGKDVEISPKKAYVSLRRNKQFAIIQPSTKTRVDVGINLKGVDPTGRLEKSGSFNAMVSHRVRLESKTDINPELVKWLKSAYQNS